MFDMCWLDDQFLVSGSRDTRMALWRVKKDNFAAKQEVPTYGHIRPLAVKECKSAQKVRAVAFNKSYEEIAALSLNGYIHIWSAETFKQVGMSIYNVEMISPRLLKRRKERGAYLATDGRHRWSLKMTMRNDN